MRGDQSPLTIGILLAEWLCSFDVRRFRIRHHNESHPFHQSGAKPHSEKIPSRQNRELPPRAPAQNKTNQIFAMQRRVRLGEVLGERGRFGGREPPLRKRGLSPSKVFPHLLQKFSLYVSLSIPCHKKVEENQRNFLGLAVGRRSWRFWMGVSQCFLPSEEVKTRLGMRLER